MCIFSTLWTSIPVYHFGSNWWQESRLISTLNIESLRHSHAARHPKMSLNMVYNGNYSFCQQVTLTKPLSAFLFGYFESHVWSLEASVATYANNASLDFHCKMHIRFNIFGAKLWNDLFDIYLWHQWKSQPHQHCVISLGFFLKKSNYRCHALLFRMEWNPWNINYKVISPWLSSFYLILLR